MPQIEINDDLYRQLHQRATQQNQSIGACLLSLLADQSQSKSDDFNAEMLDSMADAMLVVDGNRRIQGINQRAQLLFGYTQSEIIGQSLSVLLPEDMHSKHDQLSREFVADVPQKRYMADRQIVEARKSDGSTFWVNVSLSSYRHEDETFVSAIVHDVTQLYDQIVKHRNNEAELRLLMDNATDIISLHDYHGRYRFISDSVQKILGYPSESLIGKFPYDYVHPEDKECIRERFREAREGNPPDSVIFRYLSKDGDIVWVESKSTTVLDDDGQFKHMVIIARDITQMKQTRETLEHERDKLKSFMDLSPSAVTIVDRNGRITLANKRAEEVLGITRNEIETRSYDAPDWKHTDYDGNPFPDEQQPFVRVMATKEPVWDVRHAIEKPNGERIYLSINGMPLFDASGEISEIIFTVEDCTQRKKQQDKLETALEREREINRMRSDFLALVSHELRTPLSIITTSTGLMRLKHGDMTREQVDDRLTRIEAQVKRLNRLIADVTMVNRADSYKQRITLVEVNLETFFDTIITELSQAYDYSGDVDLIHADTRIITQDRTLLEHIFMNLISNAMKYNRKGGKIDIQYFVTAERFSAIVRDEGIGIPEKDQRNMFELFHRASNVGKIAGTGLGLSIVKNAVDKLNGEIIFETAEGEGTQFIVILPLISTLAKAISSEETE